MKSLMVALLLAVIAVSLHADPKVWKIDPVHSKVQFNVSHMVISEVTGIFRDFAATVRSSSDDFSDMQVESTIQTASVSTDNDQRDNHLRSDDFLSAQKFPAMVFKSTRVERTGKDTYKVYGDLTIRDVTRSVILDASLNGVIKDPYGNMRAGFKATTSIDRFDYGVRWDKVLDTGGLIAGKNVSITLLFELVQAK